MTRDEAQDRLWELVFGDLPPEDAQALEAVVQQDPELARDLEALRAMEQASRSLPAPPLPREVRRRILREARRRVRGSEAPSFWQRWVGWSPVAMAAAATVAIAVVGAHLWQRQQETLSIRGPEGLPGIAVRQAEAPAAREEPSPKGEAAGEGAEVRALASGAAVPEAEAGQDQGPRTLTAPAPTMEAGGKAGPARTSRPMVPAPGRKAPAGKRPEAAPEQAPQAPPWDMDRFRPVDAVTGGGGLLGTAAPQEPTRGAGGLGRGPAERKATRAPAQAAPAAMPESREREAGVREEAPRCPDRVRTLRSEGRRGEALAMARACLDGALAGEDLLETLDLAARIARELGRTEEADEYLRRLRALPGGEDRARRILTP